MEIAFENTAQCYLKRDFRKFYEYCDRILNIINIKTVIRENIVILKSFMGVIFLGNIGKKNHLMVFNNFEKNNGYLDLFSNNCMFHFFPLAFSLWNFNSSIYG